MVFEAGTAGLRTALFTPEPKNDEQIVIIVSLTWRSLFFEICPFKRLMLTRKKDGSPEITRS